MQHARQGPSVYALGKLEHILPFIAKVYGKRHDLSKARHDRTPVLVMAVRHVELQDWQSSVAYTGHHHRHEG